LFVREYGTNNFPDCSNMCHEPSGSAMRPQIGVGKGTVTLEDFEKADAILIFGQNPGTNHPHMLGELRAASKRGAKIVSFNPLRERGLERFADPQDKLEMATMGSTPISTHYFQLRVGGDFALVKGMMKHVVEQEDAGRAVLNHAFIAEHTTGIAALLDDLRAESWPLLEQESGLSEAQMRSAGDVYLNAGSVIACWGMGITQHVHSVATIQMITNLLLLRGNIGRPGAGPCPVRSHSNVQGDRTMGIWEKPPAALLDRLRDVFGFEPPRTPGVDVVDSIRLMLAGKGKVFFALGGNFAAATPDTYETWKGLRQCDLTVHITTKLNRSHIVHGREALILPCLGRTEIDVQAAGRGVHAAHHALARSVQHHDLRPGRPLPRRVRPASRRLHQPCRHQAPGAARRRMGGSAHRLGRRHRAPRRPLQAGRLRHPARQPRGVLPRDESARAAVVDGHSCRHADVQIHSRHTHASRGRRIHPARRYDVRGSVNRARHPARPLFSRLSGRVSMTDDAAPGLDELTVAILRELASAPGDAGMSLPRLGKHLGLGASVLMRALSAMGHARIGGVEGPGWVRVTQEEDRWTAALTEAGRAFSARHLGS
jgi:hypothetical protein